MVNTNLIGQSLDMGCITLLLDKYEIYFSNEVIIATIQRLTNQIWKLLPMKENGEDWESQLVSVIIEVTGLAEIYMANPFLLSLLAKLEGLKIVQEISFKDYRKTIFEAISLIQEIKGQIKDE